VLAAFDAPVNVELKMEDSTPCAPPKRGDFAAAMVSALHADTHVRRVLVSSFDPAALDAVHAADASVELALLAFAPHDPADAKQRGFQAIQLQSLLASAEQIAAIHAAGLEAHVWTVDAPDKMGELIDLGVDRIITNEPDRLALLRDERCAAYTCPPAADPPPPAVSPTADGSGSCAVRGRSARPAGACSGVLWAALALLGLAARRRPRAPRRGA
jgi:hypothetical protein